MNSSAVSTALVPLGVVTVMVTVPDAPVGGTAVIVVDEGTVRSLAREATAACLPL